MSVDYSKLPRAEKLYILSQICITNHVTPKSQGFNGLIVRVCTSKFATSKDKAQQYAADLISAYEADMWEGLAASHQPIDEAPETCTPRVFIDKKPTLTALDLLTWKTTEPIKHIQPQLAVEPAEYSPHTVAAILYKMAKTNEFNRVGRINLKEVKYELDNTTLRCEDIVRLLKQFYPQTSVEQRAGNNVLVYFDGKDTARAYRDINRIVQPSQPSLTEPKAQQNGNMRRQKQWERKNGQTHPKELTVNGKKVNKDE
jgi:hypothetical protein